MAIAWIMAHRPADRPSMLDLQTVLLTGVGRNFDEEGRTSIEELLNSPQPPPCVSHIAVSAELGLFNRVTCHPEIPIANQ